MLELHTAYYKYRMVYLVRLLLCSILLLVSGSAAADIGVVLPGDREEPDESVLSMEELRIDVRIDHQHARVKILQIFGNRTSAVQEGKYVFAIPADAAISDFAVWDGVIRIPGVVLERKRASEIYESLKLQYIDPGLLQQEEGAEGPRMASAFSARLTPIPAYGTKRLELEYTQKVSLEGLQSYFSIPLKPDLFRVQRVGRFAISIEVINEAGIENFQIVSSSFPVQINQQDASRIAGAYEARTVELSEDFSLRYEIPLAESRLLFLPYRGSEKTLRAGQPVTAFQKPSSSGKEDGYFWVSAVIGKSENRQTLAPKSVLILFDISASMHWEKLQQAYAALEFFLRNLPQQDEFQLVLFHQEVFPYANAPLPVTPGNVDAALAFVRSKYLMGGTDFTIAMQTAAAQAALLKNKERYLVLITDGNPTMKTVQTKNLLSAWEQTQKAQSMRAFCFGIGNDSNRTFLSGIAERSNGYFDWVRETEDIQFKLQAFFQKIGQEPVTGLQIDDSSSQTLYQIYPADPLRVYHGSSGDWYGRYRSPQKGISISVNGRWKNEPVQLQQTVDLPEEDAKHNFIPRGWARQRVDALLRKMELEGEDQASIDEIIALAKKYKFVTPYTSFLAAPRSLLRPRVIRPGDPLLRVRTDPEIVSVTVVFPFGAVQSLRYLAAEDIWQTRFLVPKNMKDGLYRCRLILQDRAGNHYFENKSLLVDGHPPEVKVFAPHRAARGSIIKVRVSADADTRYLHGHLQTLAPFAIRWDKQEKASVGLLKVPAEIPPGTYVFEVVAEDFAHNQTRSSMKMEVF